MIKLEIKSVEFIKWEKQHILKMKEGKDKVEIVMKLDDKRRIWEHIYNKEEEDFTQHKVGRHEKGK